MFSIMFMMYIVIFGSLMQHSVVNNYMYIMLITCNNLINYMMYSHVFRLFYVFVTDTWTRNCSVSLRRITFIFPLLHSVHSDNSS